MTRSELDPDLARLGDALRASTTVDLASKERTARTSHTPARPGRARLLRRPRILAGSTLGLAGVGAAVVVALSTSATQPAFAVTPHRDGTVSVNIYRKSGISGANRKLASMGIHERLFAVANRSARTTSVSGRRNLTSTSGPSSVAGMPKSCLRDQETGRVVVVVFRTAKEQQSAVGTGTYVPPADAGNTGGVPNPDTFQVITCSASTTGNTGSGNTGNS